MKPIDILTFSTRASLGYPARTFLMLLAMAIGVASMVVLSTLEKGPEPMLSASSHPLAPTFCSYCRVALKQLEDRRPCLASRRVI